MRLYSPSPPEAGGDDGALDSVFAGGEGSFFFDGLPAVVDELEPFESVTYHPAPLNWIGAGCNTLCTLLRRQFGHRSIGGSLNFCSLSNWYLQWLHR